MAKPNKVKQKKESRVAVAPPSDASRLPHMRAYGKMRKVIAALAVLMLGAQVALAQTATLTPTVPTATPTVTLTRTPTITQTPTPGDHCKTGWCAFSSSTLTIDPASCGATTRCETRVQLAGLQPGDLLVLEPPLLLNDDLIYEGVRVDANGSFLLLLYNPTGGSIDQASAAWRYIWFDRTDSLPVN